MSNVCVGPAGFAGGRGSEEPACQRTSTRIQLMTTALQFG